MLLGVAFDEFFVDIAPDEGEGLFLQVAGLGGARGAHGGHGFLFLLFDDALRFRRGGAAPHLVEGVHVEGQVVALAAIFCHGHVGEAVEGHERIHEIPHLLAGGVEDVRPVFVHVDAVLFFTIEVAAQVRPFVDDEASLARLVSQVGKGGTE